MGNSTGNTIIEKLLQLKEHYKDARTYCKRTEIDDCGSCRAGHYLEARLDTIDGYVALGLRPLILTD